MSGIWGKGRVEAGEERRGVLPYRIWRVARRIVSRV